MSVDAACRDLALANRILAHEGVVDAFGHVSLRHPDRPGHFLLSRSVSPDQVVPEDIMCFGPDGQAADGDARAPYLERFIHAAIYEARPDVTALVHSHAHDLIPFGVTGTEVRPLLHVAGPLGRVPVWDIADRFGETSLLVTNMMQGRDLAERLGAGRAVLMRGHGGVVVGDGLRAAVIMAVYLQVNAGLDLKARQLGPVRYLSDGEVARSFDAILAEGPARRAWEHFKRKVDTHT
ncbi:MAG: class II aldolase/adducin family protein [Niveispirillum sp.]|uniref:class II aldolase/adducin family protein n=1 Tax=Niveispirillum sp. TaxID=1917217 RepID=UPI0040371CA1